MYIVRWLIGHPMIAVLFLAVIAIFLNYGSGDKGTSHAVSKQSSAEVVSDTGMNEQTEESSLSDNAHKLIVKSEDISDKKLIVDGAKLIEDKSNNKTEVSKSSDITSVNFKAEANNAVDQTVMNSAASTLSQQGQAQNTASNKATETVIMDLDQSSADELLKMAREAYWNNGLDEAAQIYQQLIELEPKVLEHKGELGNVLWRQGYPQKAAELYSEIAIPMIEDGNAERVANMIGFIGLFFPDRASVIHDRIQRVGQSKNNQEK